MKVLVGLHDDRYSETYVKLISAPGIEVMEATNSSDRELLIHQHPDAHIIMDINLGYPRSDDPTSVLDVYEMVREHLDTGDIGLYAISGNVWAVQEAYDRGVPKKYLHEAGYGPDPLFDWLESLA